MQECRLSDAQGYSSKSQVGVCTWKPILYYVLWHPQREILLHDVQVQLLAAIRLSVRLRFCSESFFLYS